MGLIKSLVATYKFAKAGGDLNTGEIRQKPKTQPEPVKDAAPAPTAKKPEGWNANTPASGDWPGSPHSPAPHGS